MGVEAIHVKCDTMTTMWKGEEAGWTQAGEEQDGGRVTGDGEERTRLEAGGRGRRMEELIAGKEDGGDNWGLAWAVWLVGAA